MACPQTYISEIDVDSAFQRLAVLRLSLRASRLQIVHNDTIGEQPDGAITEIYRQRNDVNAGFGGKHVWIVPCRTSNLDDAGRGFHVSVVSTSIDGMSDLAKDSGGKFR